MNCDIVVRSYYKDIDWLCYCLAAIHEHAVGFGSVVVVLPESSEPWLRRMSMPPGNARFEWCEEFSDDYLGQQVTKLYADSLTDAELICHLDSDCILSRRTTPESLAPSGRPFVVTRPASQVDRHVPWQGPTEEFLGWPARHDFMQQPPFVYPRWLYPAVREHCRIRHGMELSDYVVSRPPRGFSEFNALGGFAFERFPDHFNWVETTMAPEPHCRWFWSWGGLGPSERRVVESLIRHRG